MKIYISYSPKDTRLCFSLINALRSKKYNVILYMDRLSDKIANGDNKLANEVSKYKYSSNTDTFLLSEIGVSILEYINESIKEADIFLVVITDNYLKYSWTQTELSAAILRCKGINLLPIVIGDLFLPDSLSDIRYIKVKSNNNLEETVLNEINTIKQLDNINEYFNNIKPLLSTTEILNQKISLLQRSLYNNQLSLVCGAGISQEASIPCWSELLLGILDNAVNRDNGDVTSYDTVNIQNLISQFPQSSIIVGKYLKNLLGNNFEMIVRKNLYSSFKKIESTEKRKFQLQNNIPGLKYYHTSKMIKSIVELTRPKRSGKRLESIITFNFDDLIEFALQQEGIECSPIWKEGQRCDVDKLPIYHVHGYLPRSGELDQPNLVFSEDAYHTQFIDPFNWSNLIQLNTYNENVCLFIGLSLVDPNLRRLLDISHRKNNDCKNYIIMRKPKQQDNKISKIYTTVFEQDANSLGLNVLWVSDYSEVPLFIQKIVKE